MTAGTDAAVGKLSSAHQRARSTLDAHKQGSLSGDAIATELEKAWSALDTLENALLNEYLTGARTDEPASVCALRQSHDAAVLSCLRNPASR